jgi:hypothetical protein
VRRERVVQDERERPVLLDGGHTSGPVRDRVERGLEDDTNHARRESTPAWVLSGYRGHDATSLQSRVTIFIGSVYRPIMRVMLH